MLPRASGATHNGNSVSANKPPLARPTSSPATTTLPPVSNNNGGNGTNPMSYGVTPPSPARQRANPAAVNAFTGFSSLANTVNTTNTTSSGHHLSTSTGYGSPPPLMGPLLPSSYHGSSTLPNTPTAADLKRSVSSDSVRAAAAATAATAAAGGDGHSAVAPSTNRFFFPPDITSYHTPTTIHPPGSAPPSNSSSPIPFDSPLRPNMSLPSSSSSRANVSSTTINSSLPPLTSPTAVGGGSFGVSPPRPLGSLESPRHNGYHFDAAGTAHLGGHLYVSTGLRTNAAGVPLSRAISPTAASVGSFNEPLVSTSHAASVNHSSHSHILGGDNRRRASSTVVTAPTLFSITTADGKEVMKPDPATLHPLPLGPPPRSWMDESFSDWSVEIGSKVYRLHKMALGRGPRRSDFFLRMFTTSMRSIESSTCSTDLTEALPRRCDDVWEAVLDYIYDGYFAPSTVNALPMLRLAQYLQVDTLQQKMHVFITQSLGRETGLVYLLDGVELKQDDVLMESMITVARYFQTYPLQQLVSLPPDLFRAITSKEKINISSENDIFYAVKKYCESREGLSGAEIASLYSSCRYALMSADALLLASRTSGVPHTLLMDGMLARLLRQEKTSGEFEQYVKTQDEPWRFEQRTGVNRQFIYVHDGDTNGLLHWIGTQHGTQPWTNPNKLGLVGLSSSQVDRGQLTDLLEEKNSSFFLNPASNAAWFAIDLGKYHIIPTHYTLRHSQVNPADHFIRNWKLQGSNDGIHWTTIMSHKRDTCIDMHRLTATFAVPTDSAVSSQSFNKLKVMSTGQNSSNRGYFLVSGFEVYGTATNVPPLAKAIMIGSNNNNPTSTNAIVNTTASSIHHGGLDP